ncbi:MAG: toprim domain-containing protein [Solirubrobacteraceae bacterium]
MSSPDVRAFYLSLGIELPAWSMREAPVRCFAQPDAHNHADRSPSCSINLTSGAFNCHRCGAHGGAYDAALSVGHTPRSAMALLITHGLAAPRPSDRRSPASPPARRSGPPHPTPKHAITGPLAAEEHDVQHWAKMLDNNNRLIRLLGVKRAWDPHVIGELELGFDGARITIPIRDRHGTLRGVLRYDPFGPRNPKMLAVAGTRHGLIPHPGSEASNHIILVEGPPDMLAARSRGLPAVAIPGTTAWQPPWGQLLSDRRVTIVMDCDAAGRRAASQIAAGLWAMAIATEVVDLWPDRHDGYDLTDRILEYQRTQFGPQATLTSASLLRPVPSIPHNRTQQRARNTQEAAP